MGRITHYQSSVRRAFSLVELSIVLVILGLLVGGVLSGRSLIKASELRSVMRDFEKYHAATMTFKDKYFYYPGDMPNATTIWGVAGGTGSDAACYATATVDSKTCNGDADNAIRSQEMYLSWKHLSNAGLIEGQYSGTQDPAGVATMMLTAGVNMPASKIYRGGFSLGNFTGQAGVKFGTAANNSDFSGQHIDLVQGTTIAVVTSGQQSTPFSGVVSHQDAFNIDTKLDDGKANTGKVRADMIKSNGNWSIAEMTCLTYDLANTTNTCALGYIFGQ